MYNDQPLGDKLYRDIIRYGHMDLIRHSYVRMYISTRNIGLSQYSVIYPSVMYH